MTALGEYISGRGEAPSRRELNRIIDRYEWFTTARRARAVVTGEPDPALVLPLMFWGACAPRAREIPLHDTEDRPTQPDGVAEAEDRYDVIERFIEHGGYRIVPSDEAREVEVDIEIDPEMVSEELAEIYRAQGMIAEAEKIYRILKSK